MFNLGGYGLFMSRLEDKATQELDKQLDNKQYNPALLISIKIPLPKLPYYTASSSAYERRYGKFDIDGIIYNCFQQRVYNDSLEVVCILDAEATRLNALKKGLVKTDIGLLPGTAGKKKGAAGGAFKFFSPGNCVAKKVSKNARFYKDALERASRASLILPFYYVTVIDDPPET